MAKALALLVLALFLAGCSAGPPAHGPRPSTTSTFTVTGDNRIAEPAFTDTYHFLARPDVTPTPPDASEPVRVPVTSLYDQTSGLAAEPPRWSFVLPQDVQGLMGTATVWVEVTGTVTGNPFSQTPAGGCFWCLDALIDGEFIGLGSRTEGLQVQPGIYELHFAFSQPDRALAAGTTVQVSFTTGEWVARAPGTTVEVLTASVPYDSVLQIYGLQLPVEPALVLRATT